MEKESGAQSPQSQKVRKNLFTDIRPSQEGGLSERVKKESDKEEPLALDGLQIDDSEPQVDKDEQNNSGPDPSAPEHLSIKVGTASAGKRSGSKQDTTSSKSAAGPQKLINFNVVQQICQQNQIFNEKKKDEILEEQMQLMNDGQQNTPIVVLDNPYQDLDKVISKAKS